MQTPAIYNPSIHPSLLPATLMRQTDVASQLHHIIYWCNSNISSLGHVRGESDCSSMHIITRHVTPVKVEVLQTWLIEWWLSLLAHTLSYFRTEMSFDHLCFDIFQHILSHLICRHKPFPHHHDCHRTQWHCLFAEVVFTFGARSAGPQTPGCCFVMGLRLVSWTTLKFNIWIQGIISTCMRHSHHPL